MPETTRPKQGTNPPVLAKEFQTVREDWEKRNDALLSVQKQEAIVLQHVTDDIRFLYLVTSILSLLIVLTSVITLSILKKLQDMEPTSA